MLECDIAGSSEECWWDDFGFRSFRNVSGPEIRKSRSISYSLIVIAIEFAKRALSNALDNYDTPRTQLSWS